MSRFLSFGSILLVLVFLGVTSGSAVAAVPIQSDTCATPTAIGGITIRAFDTTSSTMSGFDGGGLPCNAMVDRDVFYAWTSVGTGDFCFDTCGAGIDTTLQVHAGSDCSAVCLTSNDDDTLIFPSCAPGSRVLVNGIQPGDTFLVQVGGPLGAAGGTGFLTVDVCPDQPLLCSPASPNATGLSTTLYPSYFVPTPGSSGLHLEATHGAPGQFGLFMVSSGANASTPLGNGVLCLTIPICRYSPRVAGHQGNSRLNSVGQFDETGNVFVNKSGTSTTGTGFDVPTTIPCTPGGQAIAPGDTWYFQLWHRDADPGGMSVIDANLSDVFVATF
tara:strand:+ start:2972 stop:3961 length:990 start_codon:yes stop_codon:yes gene_type:complete